MGVYFILKLTNEVTVIRLIDQLSKLFDPKVSHEMVCIRVDTAKHRLRKNEFSE